MTIKRTLRVGATVSAMALMPSPGHAQSQLNTTDLSGRVHIQQDVPCGDPVDLNLNILDGEMDIAPRSITRGEAVFDLARLVVFVTPFSVSRACMGISATADFREIGLQLATALRFTAEETGPLGSGLYRFVIPKEKFLLYESVLNNGPAPQPEAAYRHPSEDVTGLISLNPRRQFVQLHVVFTERLHFQAGCMRGGRCLIDERHVGTITSDLLALSEPGPTPPSISCTSIKGNSFRVSADDGSGTPTIQLGSHVLTNGELFRLQQTGQPGVRLIEKDRDGVRQFHSGRADDFVIVTSNATGLSAIAFCR